MCSSDLFIHRPPCPLSCLTKAQTLRHPLSVVHLMPALDSPCQPAGICNHCQAMPAPEVNLPQQSTVQPLPAGARRFERNKGGRPTRRCKGGQRAWLKRLQRAGRMAEAAEWARRCNLHPEPEPAEAATPAEAAAGATGSPTAATAATSAPVPHGAGEAGLGGAGGDQAAGRENGDKSTPSGIILQCSATAAAPTAPAEPAGPGLIRGLTGDSLPLIAASPSGEVEGKMTNCQSGSISEADGQGVKAEDSVMEKGWPKVCEAWVGVRGRKIGRAHV